MEKLTMNVSEAAKALGLCAPVVYDLIKSNRGFPHIQVGRRIVIPTEALRRWVDSQTPAPPQQ